MERKRLTQIFPFLLPIRIKQRKLFFYLAIKLDRNKYAKEKRKSPLENLVYEEPSPMINENSGYDIIYQHNKAHNLKVAAKALNGILIRPGECFSLCYEIKNADKKEKYLDGLSLVNGEIKGEYGGGLCQLSNLLYWLFLNSSLTIIERHGHGSEAIPPMDSEAPVAVDATISEGWLDLKVKNATMRTYQILIEFKEDVMIGRLYSSEAEPYTYRIYNSEVKYIKHDSKVYEEAIVMREKTSVYTGSKRDEFLYRGKCEITYNIEEKGVKI